MYTCALKDYYGIYDYRIYRIGLNIVIYSLGILKLCFKLHLYGGMSFLPNLYQTFNPCRYTGLLQIKRQHLPMIK